MSVEGFAGNWTYRSFYNRPEFGARADELIDATADLVLEVGGTGGTSAGLDLDGGSEISGTLSIHNGFSLSLTMSGVAKPGNPPTIRLRATGVEDTVTAGWIYDYIGYLVPSWPEAVGQRSTIVGTVIRTVEHMGGLTGDEVRPAGDTMSFIAVSA